MEGLTTDKLAPQGPRAQIQPLATQQIHSLQWAQHFPRASQDSAESLVCITDPPSVIAAGLLAPRLCTGTSVSKGNSLGWGKAATALKKKLSPMRLLPAIP